MGAPLSRPARPWWLMSLRKSDRNCLGRWCGGQVYPSRDDIRDREGISINGVRILCWDGTETSRCGWSGAWGQWVPSKNLAYDAICPLANLSATSR
ncbi:hypothetical protein ElyMa_000914300 [Elysia marginata]|uniref:Sushi domain-containing protein n=1 Tax=Elysia marginata TaxID=1093978 RepID=A0AAV4HBZ3_9GAST|nr:hypothetical protein ElyMa_000914300 [Elysia marginata]